MTKLNTAIGAKSQNIKYQLEELQSNLNKIILLGLSVYFYILALILIVLIILKIYEYYMHHFYFSNAWQKLLLNLSTFMKLPCGSIGMAKSALEAINGCNLFGEKGASWSVVYVDIDAHNRNRSIFETMLPRESSSKDVDVSLIPTVSFPCFATHDECLCNETKEHVIRKLQGKYGFKRFRRDGFLCPKEDPNRRFYRVGETKEFENIECEWPLFYIFMIIDGVFKTLPSQVEEYEKLLNDVMQKDSNGGIAVELIDCNPLVPMCYTLPLDVVDAEKSDPGSQSRIGCFGMGWLSKYHSSRIPAKVEVNSFRKNGEEDYNEGEDNDEENGKTLFLWGQAMYIISKLLTEKLLHVTELDPVRRHLPSFSRPHRGGRYSAFQVSL
ncbi:hypothetical protein J437_LFUL010675 [Ladona fulva]|uniref:Phosphorylase b kinase regulatory subunit n=1 Tax=Ladona fulva TaxID=123851 RepID=A0A8K0K935_LADFU|nr:hypothetical protein J437_LFUL010675 [Ladona fulva]